MTRMYDCKNCGTVTQTYRDDGKRRCSKCDGMVFLQ